MYFFPGFLNVILVQQAVSHTVLGFILFIVL